MSEAAHSRVSAGEILSGSWRMFRTHFRTFALLMGLPVGALILSTLIMYFFLVPLRTGVSLREVWGGMSVVRKIGVVLLFLATIAVLNRALTASIFVVREFHDRRGIGVLSALGYVRRKHLRLFWLLFLLSSFSAGPQAFVVLLLGLFFAPAFPIAVLENLGVIASLRRSNVLTKGGYGRIAVLFLLYLGLVVGGAFGLFGPVFYFEQFFGNAWFMRLIFGLAFWIFLLIPQWYMIALTLNYFDQRARKGQWAPDAAADA